MAPEYPHSSNSLADILALRDCVKGKLTRLMLDENSLVNPPYDLLNSPSDAVEIFDRQSLDEWGEFRTALFQYVLDDVGVEPLEPSARYHELNNAMEGSPGHNESKEHFRKLLATGKFIFFACNYFNPLLDPPIREPAVNVVNPVDSHAVRSAYNLFKRLRLIFRAWDDLGYYPINDLIAEQATTKRVWAVCFSDRIESHKFVRGNFSLEDISDKTSSMPLSENHTEVTTLVVPKGAFADIGAETFPRIDPEGWADASGYEKWKDKHSGLLEGTLEYLQWNFFRNQYHKEAPATFRGRPGKVDATDGERRITLKDAYVALASLQPFVRQLGMVCHYAFPAYFAVPQSAGPGCDRGESAGGVTRRPFCSTLSVATRKPLQHFERKILSDLAVRLLLTPLIEDYGIRVRATEQRRSHLASQRSHLTGCIGNQRIANQILDEKKDYFGDTVCVFADVCGFTSAFHKLQKENYRHPEIAREVLTFFRYLWSSITRIVVKYKGAVGSYIGDGIFFYFTEAGPFKEAYPGSNEKTRACNAFLCVLELRGIIEQASAHAEARFLKYFKDPSFHIGMYDGYCVFGNVADPTAFHFSAMSSVVNLAARMMSLAGANEIVAENDLLNPVFERLSKANVDYEPWIRKSHISLTDLVLKKGYPVDKYDVVDKDQVCLMHLAKTVDSETLDLFKSALCWSDDPAKPSSPSSGF